MSTEVLVALLSLAGTAIGSVAGILAANRLTAYRLQQLEAKVDRHNCLMERMAVVETSVKSAHRRIDELERSHI